MRQCIASYCPQLYPSCYLTADTEKEKNEIFPTARKWHPTKTVYKLQDIAETMQINLFHHTKRSSHGLHHLYITKNSDCIMSSCSVLKQNTPLNVKRVIKGAFLSIHISE
jgi:hypothetical protein